jgi:hypothetical protein
MANKSFGVKQLGVISSSGTPTIESTTDLIVNANNVAISTNLTVANFVGIGTTNPLSALDISGNVNISGIITASSFVGNLTGTATTATTASNLTKTVTAGSGLNGGGTLTSNVTLDVNVGTGITISSDSVALKNGDNLTDNRILKWNDGSGQLTDSIITDTGTNIGIGSTQPTSKFEVIGDASISGNLKLNTIDLGNNTDTTISRSSAGVVFIEDQEVVTTTRDQLLQNKTYIIPFVQGQGVSLISGSETTYQYLFPALFPSITLSVGTYEMFAYIIASRTITGAASSSLRIRNIAVSSAATGTFTGTSTGSSPSFFNILSHHLSQSITDPMIITPAGNNSGNYISKISGILRIGVAGNYIPGYSMSATINSSVTCGSYNYMILRKISSSGSIVAQGGWGAIP